MTKSSLRIDSKSPKELVDILDDCGGDLQKFAEIIELREDTRVVLMRAEMVLLDEPKEYLRWNQLIQARNQAHFKLAQQKAYEAIGKYNVPDNAALTTMLAYQRFWFAASSVGEQTRARKEAASTTGSAEARELDALFEGLTGES